MRKDQLAQMVVDATGRSDKLVLINQYLDLAIQGISRMHPFDNIRTEVSIQLNTLDISSQLPWSVQEIIELRLLVPSSPTISYPLRLHRKTWFMERFPNVAGSTITGRPIFCYRDKNLLFYNLKSNGIYTIVVSCTQLGCFDSPGSEPNIRGCDEAVVAYATARLKYSIEDVQQGTFWMSEYHRLAQELINHYQREIGVRNVADMWTRKPSITANEPWRDPFEGLQGSSR